MDNPPSPPTNDPAQPPTPEVLKPREAAASSTQTTAAKPGLQTAKKPGRRSYRPSHRATVMGIGAVMVILAVNAAVIGLVLKKQSKTTDLSQKGQVTISSSQLNQLGVNRSPLGTAGVLLSVSPDAEFKGKLSVDGNANISGTVTLDSKLTGTDALLTQLEAGNTTLSQLNVNGDGTISTLNLRKDLKVAGVTQLQGALTVNGSAGIAGNLTVGGVLSVSNFSARSLTSVSNFTVGGHIITSGTTPGLSKGNALGSNGTVAISGNDASGTVSFNVGVGASGGTIASVSFHTAYGSTPQVVFTPVGIGANFYLSSVSANGFTVAVTSGLPPGGYSINYIVEE